MLIIFCVILYVISSKLVFDEKGKFKILQITDIHYGKGVHGECKDVDVSKYPCSGKNTTDFLRKVIKDENPDFIVFTGDNIDGNCEDSTYDCLDETFKVATEKGIQWSAILGNHDHYAEKKKVGRKGIIEYIEKMPFSLTEMGPEEVKGYGNYKLDVYDNKSNDVKFSMFMFDTGEWSLFHGIDAWEWLYFSQIQWYWNLANHKIPAIAFTHIPLLETDELIRLKVKIVGDKFAWPYKQLINSGLFATFIEKGDVKGVFSGHWHQNDYCAFFELMQLCFGGVAGYEAAGKLGWARRARVIEIQDFGQSIYTWKRLDDATLSTKDYQQLWNNTVTSY